MRTVPKDEALLGFATNIISNVATPKKICIRHDFLRKWDSRQICAGSTPLGVGTKSAKSQKNIWNLKPYHISLVSMSKKLSKEIPKVKYMFYLMT